MLFMKAHYLCRIDREGCIGCSLRNFSQTEVIPDHLAQSWELSSRERIQFDEREGNICSGCGLSKRVRMIVWTLRKLFPDLSPLDILHLNQINGLKPLLVSARSVTETLYHPGFPTGTEVQGWANEDMSRLSFKNNRFDLVIHSETLEHLHDYVAALTEAMRVLRSGGYQIYTVPLLHQRATRRRIGLGQQEEAVYLFPPSYHGKEGEYPVIWEFGGDFLKQRRPQIHRIFYDNYWQNRTVFTIVERKA
jgi:SAM-dependent methyltransferase